jgi:dimethylargininase
MIIMGEQLFSKAIVKIPGRSIVHGITSTTMGLPVYEKAVDQHRAYCDALKKCGLELIVMPPDELYPDSCFVEDTALITPKCTILTSPGAKSRQGEISDMRNVLNRHFSMVYNIDLPGTVEAGDIMMVGNHFYIGLSDRTNKEGAEQIIRILKDHGHTADKVTMTEMLHLKTGVSYLENNNLLICGEFLTNEIFRKFNHIVVDSDEAYSANAIWVNGTVILPRGFDKTRAKVERAGYSIIEVDVSEFQKVDGGLSCLSLRF